MSLQSQALGALVEPVIEQGGPASAEFTYIDIGSIDRETKCIVDPKVLPKSKAPSRAKQRLQAGDVLVSMTRPNLNAVALVPPEYDGAIGSTGFHVLRARDALPGYLFYAVQTPGFVDAMCRKVQGALYPAVRPRDIAGYSIGLPDKAEQRRIVAEIEKQFTRLDAGVAALRRVQANLKRYRAAVLKAACEGRLVPTEAELARKEALLGGSIPVADFDSRSHGSKPPSKRGLVLQKAREAGSTPAAAIAGDTGGVGGSTPSASTAFETGEQLLARILVDRRRNWQGRGSYKEPVAPDTGKFSSLPKGWTWASLDQLLGVMRNGISAKPDAEIGLPILRISAVRALSVNLSEIRYLNDKASDYSDYVLTEGDLLFTRYNGNPKLVGVCGVVPTLTSPIVHPDKLIRCKLVASGALPDFVAIMANVGVSRDYLAKRVRTTAGQAGISGGDLKGLPIPLAPLIEQKRIVAEVERRLSVIDELESVATANLARAARLRQSTLQTAFSGKRL